MIAQTHSVLLHLKKKKRFKKHNILLCTKLLSPLAFCWLSLLLEWLINTECSIPYIVFFRSSWILLQTLHKPASGRVNNVFIVMEETTKLGLCYGGDSKYIFHPPLTDMYMHRSGTVRKSSWEFELFSFPLFLSLLYAPRMESDMWVFDSESVKASSTPVHLFCFLRSFYRKLSRLINIYIYINRSNN